MKQRRKNNFETSACALGLPLALWIGLAPLAGAEESTITGPAVIMNGVEVSPGISMTEAPVSEPHAWETLSAASCEIPDDSLRQGGWSLKDFYSGVASEVPVMPTRTGSGRHLSGQPSGDNGRIGLALTGRYLADRDDYGEAALTVAYGLTGRLTAGIDYRPLSGDVSGIGAFRILNENDWRPAVVAGTSADEFDSVLSQAYHVIFSKELAAGGFTISPFAGPVYIQELEEFNVTGGLSLRYADISLTGMWSGTDAHLMAKYDISKNFSAGLVWWGLETAGVTVAVNL